jgi:hypothetical protein
MLNFRKKTVVTPPGNKGTSSTGNLIGPLTVCDNHFPFIERHGDN